MTNGSTLSLPEIEDRIAILRDNIRQLTEQAAALSGAADEARAADRIAAQQADLDRLIAERDAILAGAPQRGRRTEGEACGKEEGGEEEGGEQEDRQKTKAKKKRK